MAADAIDLWVLAGSDGVRMGGDPVCQQVFMTLYLKTNNSEHPASKHPQFNVQTTNPLKPHAQFRTCGLRQVPGLVHGNVVLEQLDDILEYIDEQYPSPSLRTEDDGAAEDACSDLFSKFCWYIREVNRDPKGLTTELFRIDSHLKSTGSRFLAGDNITHVDCRILPKLHQIRIAGDALKDYHIPEEFVHLWAYLGRAYSDLEAFRKTCACDQEIVLYWADRRDTPNLTPQRRTKMLRETPVFSFDLPTSIGMNLVENS